MNQRFDVIILGSGFGGSLLSLCLQKSGRRVLMLEKEKHPRFAIGESSTPLANLFLEEIADEYNLPELKPLCQWGSWQQEHPGVGCGLKRGFTFYHHEPHRDWMAGPDRERELLVAASPEDSVADTHWYRPDFDALLVRFARNRGVEVIEEFQIHSIETSPGKVRVSGQERGKARTFEGNFIVDATGPRGILSRLFGLAENKFQWFPDTSAAYAHFEGVEKFSGQFPEVSGMPYPPDDAAVHHVFPGGWAWVLRFNNGITSAGGVWTREAARMIDQAPGNNSWESLLHYLPSLKRCFRNSRTVVPIRTVERLPYLTHSVTGPGWALLPSAAGFVDPLLSNGFPLTLFGVVRLAAVLQMDEGTARQEAIEKYRCDTLADLEATENLLAALHGATAHFTLFNKLTLLYFAAASFSETARRLGKHERAQTFLLRNDTAFGPGMRQICAKTLSLLNRGTLSAEEVDKLSSEIDAIIEPINIAGLTRPRKPSWYPVDVGDLYAGAGKLNSTSHEIAEMLRRCGFKLSGSNSNLET